jgi:hypothetical protein
MCPIKFSAACVPAIETGTRPEVVGSRQCWMAGQSGERDNEVVVRSRGELLQP